MNKNDMMKFADILDSMQQEYESQLKGIGDSPEYIRGNDEFVIITDKYIVRVKEICLVK